jgi:anthranilate phosphoribosyltransferase
MGSDAAHKRGHHPRRAGRAWDSRAVGHHVANAAAALYVGGAADGIAAGLALARRVVEGGAATDKLEALVEFTNR